MSQPAEHVAGNIYDLGYQRYGGVRLGRRHAVLAVYVQSLRSAFGLGRRTSSKIIPMGLAIVVLIPASIQLGIAAIAPGDVELIKFENYLGFVEIILALFCAAVAPELLGRDQRTNTLSLYFSRALLRRDYALAKFGALVSAMLVVTLGPLVLLFAGNALGSDDSLDYLKNNADQVLPIVASTAMLSIFFASLGLAVAAQTPRRAFATGGVLALFVVSSSFVSIMVNAASEDYSRYLPLVSPFHLVRGFTFFFFQASFQSGTGGVGGDLYIVDLPGAVYALATLGITAVAAALLLRRYERIAA
jgi:ABC-2 type transport system permease protein